jgi:hypothetical protein
MWMALIPMAISLIGSMKGMQAGEEMQDLAYQQGLIAEQNAVLEKRELQETVRRKEAEDRRLQGTALARAAGSGARVEGSVKGYLDYMDEESGRQLDWLKSAGASRIRLKLAAEKLRVQASMQAGESQSTSALFGGLTSMFSSGMAGGLFS